MASSAWYVDGVRLGNLDMIASTALPGIARGRKKLMVSATQAATA